MRNTGRRKKTMLDKLPQTQTLIEGGGALHINEWLNECPPQTKPTAAHQPSAAATGSRLKAILTQKVIDRRQA